MVHLLGGVFGGVGAVLVGPRFGRFRKEESSRPLSPTASDTEDLPGPNGNGVIRHRAPRPPFPFPSGLPRFSSAGSPQLSFTETTSIESDEENGRGGINMELTTDADNGEQEEDCEWKVCSVTCYFGRFPKHVTGSIHLIHSNPPSIGDGHARPLLDLNDRGLFHPLVWLVWFQRTTRLCH